jgi:hypothetical protein
MHLFSISPGYGIMGEAIDRQMMTKIVERWGGLSDELKRAVLAVVGSGRSS